MLNKNMLIWGAVDRGPHVRMNIGYGYISSLALDLFGFNLTNLESDSKFGSVDKVLFWNFNGIRVKLVGLYFNGGLGDYEFIFQSTGTVKITLGTFFKFATENTEEKGGNYSFTLKAGYNVVDNYGTTANLEFGWGDMGKNGVLSFAPPPDGYLDPNTLKPI